MTTANSASRVRLGRLEITDAVWSELSWFELLCGLVDHVQRDWGQVRQVETQQCRGTASRGPQLRTKRVTRHGSEYWIITEPKRSVTRIELAE